MNEDDCDEFAPSDPNGYAAENALCLCEGAPEDDDASVAFEMALMGLGL